MNVSESCGESRSAGENRLVSCLHCWLKHRHRSHGRCKCQRGETGGERPVILPKAFRCRRLSGRVSSSRGWPLRPWILVIRRFHLCEFTDLLRRICGPHSTLSRCSGPCVEKHTAEGLKLERPDGRVPSWGQGR